MKKLINLILLTSLLLGLPLKAAQIEDVATSVFDRVVASLMHLKQQGKLEHQALLAMVNQDILPFVDTRYFAYKVLGKHLEKLSKEQREEFVQLLTDSLMNNYAHSLKGYDNEQLELSNVTMAPSKKTSQVSMKLNGKGKNTNLTTKWRFSEQSRQWLMYDLIVEGVSLLQTKQKEMASLIAAHGPDAVISKLKAKAEKV